MSSLFRLTSSSTRLFSSHRHTLLRSFSLPAADKSVDPIDPRQLPTNYDPATFDPSNHRPPPSPRVWRLVDEIAALTLVETVALRQILIEKKQIKEPPVVAIMGAGGGGAAMAGKGGSEKGAKEEEAKKEEKTVFELKLEVFEAANKLKVIKELRGFTDLGLKEAKELVEKAPVVIKAGVAKEEGLAIVEKMKAIGAKVVLA